MDSDFPKTLLWLKWIKKKEENQLDRDVPTENSTWNNGLKFNNVITVLEIGPPFRKHSLSSMWQNVYMKYEMICVNTDNELWLTFSIEFLTWCAESFKIVYVESKQALQWHVFIISPSLGPPGLYSKVSTSYWQLRLSSSSLFFGFQTLKVHENGQSVSQSAGIKLSQV